MPRYQQTQKTRSLRSDSVSIPDSMPNTHRVCFVALLDALLHAGFSFTAGKWSIRGQIKLSVYTADEKLETFLDIKDNPAQWVEETAAEILTPGLVAEIRKRLDGLVAPAPRGAAKTAPAMPG